MTSEKMKNPKHITLMVIVGIAVGLAGFYGGMQYQKSQPGERNGNLRYGQNAQGGQMMMVRGENGGRTGGRGFGGGANIGEIINVDTNSITIKLSDGSSKIINVTNKTTISKTDTASKADLKNGDTIAAFGTPNSDGSIDSQNIQLNPMFRMGGPGGQQGPGK